MNKKSLPYPEAIIPAGKLLFNNHYFKSFARHKNRLLLLTVFLLSGLLPSFAQTTIISATGDGSFEATPSVWTLANGTQTNKWRQSTGATPGFTGTNAMYVSQSTAAPFSHAYTKNVSSIVYFYKDVTFPAGENVINLSFKLLVQGEAANDVVTVFIAPASTTPIAASATVTGATSLGSYALLGTDYTTQNITITAAQAGNATAASTRRLIFQWKNDANSAGTQPPAAIDNISLISYCTGVTASAATLIGATTAQANWAAYTGTTSYSLRYRPTGSATWATLTGLTGTLTGLTALSSSTAYEYQVSSAAGGSCPAWSASVTFTTQQLAPVTWTEGFTTTALPAAWVNTTGWTINNTSNYGVKGNTGNCIYYNLDDTTPSANFATISVGSLGTNDRIKFDRKTINYSDNTNVGDAPGSGTGNFVIAISTNYGATYATLATVINTASSGWQTYTYSLAAYAGKNIKVRITGTRIAGDYFLAFDNFIIQPTPTCDVPTAVTANAITVNSATIHWGVPAVGTPADYTYEVRSSGVAGSGSTGLVAGGTVVTGTSLSAALSGLSAGSTYYVYVRTHCSGSDYSYWSAATSFTTVCAPVNGLPWAESFNNITNPGEGVLPNCWTNDAGTGNSNYTSATATSNPDNNSNTPNSNPDYVTIYWPYGEAAYLWTPGFSLEAGVTYQFSFEFAGDGFAGWQGNVYANTSPNRTGATVIGGSFIGEADTSVNTYTPVARNFVAPATGTYYFGVSALTDSDDTTYLGFDDFSVQELSSITSFIPAAICATGGQLVEIMGLNLSGTTAVTFNGVDALQFNVVNNTSISAETPPGVTAGVISITTALGTVISTAYTILASPVVSPITGPSTVCANGTITLSSATTGGQWVSDNSEVATVNNGVVTGVAAGTANIIYNVINGCFASTSLAVTVTHAPTIPLAGDQDFCSASTIANLTAIGNNIKWYTADTGGSPLAATTALATATYYVSQTAGACESTRTAVAVTITDKNWTGDSNNDWNLGSNWCGYQVPTAADNVVIPNVTNKPVINSGIAYAKSITITDAGATLTINSGATLSVENNIASNTTTANIIVQNNGAILQGNVATTNGNTGKIAFHKNSNPLYRLDYTLWSAPITGQTLRAFSMATSNNRFYVYNYAFNGVEFDEGYWPVDPITTSFAEGKGYLVRMPNSIGAPVAGTTGTGITAVADYASGEGNYIFDGTFTGTPNNGSYNPALIQTSGPNNFKGFNAVGNPYPSPISLEAFFNGNSTTLANSTAIWLWRKKNGAETAYITLNLIGYALPYGNANGNGGLDLELASYYTGNSAAWVIAPGQGFIVQSQPSAITVNFTNSMRRATPGAQAFFRQAGGTSSRYWLNIVTQNGNGSQALIAYKDDASMGIDYGYDSKVFNTAEFSLYSIAADNKLTIQARPGFDVSDVVPMGFTAIVAGQYTISIDHTDGVFAQGQAIYLKDLQEGVIRNLSENDYTFTTEAGNFEGRFEVHYQTQALGTNNPVLDANTVIVFRQGNAININTGTAIMNSVKVFDIRGRQLYSQGGINAAETVISNLNVQQEVLIVEINTEKGTVSKRIVF